MCAQNSITEKYFVLHKTGMHVELVLSKPSHASRMLLFLNKIICHKFPSLPSELESISKSIDDTHPRSFRNRNSELFIRLFLKVSPLFFFACLKFFMNNVKFSLIMQKWFFSRKNMQKGCVLAKRHFWRSDDGKICASLIRFSIREGLPTFLRVEGSVPCDDDKCRKVRLERGSRRWTFNSERADRINKRKICSRRVEKCISKHDYIGTTESFIFAVHRETERSLVFYAL